MKRRNSAPAPGDLSYHQLRKVALPEGTLFLKPGVRHHPDLPAGLNLFRKELPRQAGPVLDASGGAGAAALVARHAGLQASVRESSAAALRCALATHEHTGVRVEAELPWVDSALQAGLATLLLAPPGDKGNWRVQAELAGAARLLAAGGTLLAVMHRDSGAKRYEKLAAQYFSDSEVIGRDSGWRLLRATGAQEGPAVEASREFRVPGFEFDLTVLPGVYGAGKLDPGSALLLQHAGLASLQGASVLDLGCGYGILALAAAAAGASVTAVDDDLAAVRSCSLNLARNALAGTVLHSDVDSALPAGQRFDLILMNPPFHVGKGVRLELPEAFIDAAWRRLARKGVLWLVANRAQPYEEMLQGWSKVERVADQNGFKVIRAVR
jgi:16S rRNA (guanine1207-N2)-methyltransferase